MLVVELKKKRKQKENPLSEIELSTYHIMNYFVQNLTCYRVAPREAKVCLPKPKSKVLFLLYRRESKILTVIARGIRRLIG